MCYNNYSVCALSPGAAATEPVCHHYYSLRAVQPVLHSREESVHHKWGSPHSLQLENLCSNEYTAQPNINK